jgi:hypothetical protein
MIMAISEVKICERNDSAGKIKNKRKHKKDIMF